MVKANDIHAFAQRIIQQIKPEKVILFGSHNTEAATEESDVDLLLICDMPEPRHKRTQKIRKMLRPLPFPVDILVYTPHEIKRYQGETGTFINDVLEKGKYLHG